MYRTANTFITRLIGRLREHTASTPLFIPRCNAVHTLGMKFPLRLIWYDTNSQVIREQLAIPNRFYTCKGASAVLELHSDEPMVQITSFTAPSSFANDKSGQALVEAAFAIPVLLVIVFSFIQIGLMVHQSQKLTYVTHYATQVGSITNDPNQISGAIETLFLSDQYTLALESRDKNANLIADSDRKNNDILTVQVEHPFTLQIPLVSLNIITLRASASARILCTNQVAPYLCSN